MPECADCGSQLELQDAGPLHWCPGCEAEIGVEERDRIVESTNDAPDYAERIVAEAININTDPGSVRIETSGDVVLNYQTAEKRLTGQELTFEQRAYITIDGPRLHLEGRPEPMDADPRSVVERLVAATINVPCGVESVKITAPESEELYYVYRGREGEGLPEPYTPVRFTQARHHGNNMPNTDLVFNGGVEITIEEPLLDLEVIDDA
ncbi:hypothetical protein SAMN05216388_1017113 [Halorientalis persicus]|uniref:Uncharacterized protein n=1 Tax=Halorientalis persicus TaxID=1367881 RepID=A0A1H8S1A7_9EURY|nr:hypothetical protein [Halorientalis persicus]SEO72471.1 hypothetical protein SAMN05216388_1017113 [Halorientalis persicus]